MSPPDDEADRAAIFARRQRFIALALSGLAACTSSEPARPSPCLDMKPARDPEKERMHREAEARERERQKQLEATPTPCLSPPPPRDPPPAPEPVADPKADAKSDPSGTAPP